MDYEPTERSEVDMRMVMICYNEAIDVEVMETLERCGLKNYTKITGAFGRGTLSGTHMGDDIWPGKNNVLFAGGKDEEARRLLACLKELRRELGKEGVKAFSWNLEEST